MKVGEIRKLNDRKIRVIGLDDLEVLYDAWWDHTQSWGMEKARTATFYRLPREYATNETEVIGQDDLTEKEIAKLRPDLPLRLCVLADLNWGSIEYDSIESFENFLGEYKSLVTQSQNIECNKLSIIPLGSKGGQKQAVTIECKSESFDPVELLWNSFNIQSKYETSEKDGIGIYRSGIKGGIPSYYLGGRFDLAGNNQP